MPIKIDQKKLFDFVKMLDEKLLTTSARKTQFRVFVQENDLDFIPVSSGVSRKQIAKNIAKIIERYNEGKSPQPKDYHDITFNSVYMVTLIEMYLKTGV